MGEGMMSRRNVLAWVSLCFVLLLLSPGLGFAAGGQEGADRTGDLLDLLYRFMNFTLLLIILFVVIRKVRVGDLFRSRTEEIQKKLDELRAGKEEAEKKFREIEVKLGEFEKKKQGMLEQFRAEGLEEKERILAEANQRAMEIVEQAEASILQEIKAARGRLQQEVVALAAQKAKDILSEQITERDQDRLVDEFIEKVRKDH
jgi:F-type H+-transporting ATPase subunit b